jgi:PAS domain S-box-containing protein
MAAALARTVDVAFFVKAGTLALCYFVTAKASLLLAIPPGYATPVWPPSGIAVAALLLYGWRIWPGVWLGAVIANFTVNQALPVAAAIATGNTLEAICAIWLVQRLMRGSVELLRPESALLFALGVAASSVVAATVGVLSLYFGGAMPSADLLANWYTWWQGDTTGIIVVTPFLLAWLRRAPLPRVPIRAAEIAIFAALLAVTVAAVFVLAGWTRPDISRALTFLLIPFMAWAGCRFDERVVSATIMAVAGVAIWATIERIGPFLFTSSDDSLLVLQAFISTTAVMGLVLCALTRERTDFAGALQQSRDRLELTVAQRTDELAQKNRELQRDIAEKGRLATVLLRRESQLAEAQAITHIGSWTWEVAADRVTWSDELFRIYGITPEQFGGTVGEYLARVHPEDRPGVTQAIQAAMTERMPWQLTERIVRPDGSIRVLKTIGRVTANEAGEIVAMHGACLDATEVDRLEQIQAVQNRITATLVQAPSWPDAVSGALRIVCEKLGWTLGQMWEVDRDANVLRHTCAWQRPRSDTSVFVDESRKSTFAPGRGLAGRTWKQAAPVWIEDIRLDPDDSRARWAEQAGLHGALCLPLVAGHNVLGVLEFFDSQVQRPQAELLHMLAALGSQLGEYIVRNQSELLLKESEERFRLLVEGVKDYAILMLDPRGHITTWNAGAERIQGYRAEDILGAHFSRFFTSEDLAAHKPERQLQAAVSQGGLEEEGWRVRRDGSRFWASVALTALRDADGRLRGFAKVIRDMTEHKRVEALEEAGRQTRQFLAMLGHELRNPLAPIRNAVSVMQMLELRDPQLRNCRDMIERQVTHLSRLVDDLLDVSRITSGKIGLQNEQIELAEVAARAVEASRPVLEARGHALEVRLPDAALEVSGDPTRLSQVLQNLLNNSAKYTPQGGNIELELTREGDSAVIRVRDDGIGIRAELLPRVFDLFMQADRGLDRSEGGLGIGLTLARQIVEMHGGSIHAASEGPGRGAAFTVRLPAGALCVARSPSPPTTQAAAAPPSTPRRTLVVDDNRDAADSMAALLDLRGHTTWVAYDGESALALAAEHAPQVVLLDIGLPGMDGYEVAARLRALAQTRNSRLIALTGYGQPEDRRRSQQAGFDRHLVKPVDFEILVGLLAAPGSFEH